MMCPGYTFELQFHTPEGMAMKMGESHHLYEEVRSPKRAESERLGLYLQLKGLWDTLPVCLALWRTLKLGTPPGLVLRILVNRIFSHVILTRGLMSCACQLAPGTNGCGGDRAELPLPGP